MYLTTQKSKDMVYFVLTVVIMFSSLVFVDASDPEVTDGHGYNKSSCDCNIKRTQHIRGKYLGCFKDQVTRGLNGHFRSSNENTVQSCTELCRSGNFVYAGVQDGYQCFCGNTMNPMFNEKVNESKCSISCIGNASQICGGFWTNSIYETGLELYVIDENGQRLPNSYISDNTMNSDDLHIMPISMRIHKMINTSSMPINQKKTSKNRVIKSLARLNERLGSNCTEQPLHAYACERSTLHIKCTQGVVYVIRENYGRLSTEICDNGYTFNVNCASNITRNYVKHKCFNKPSCSVPALNSVFGDPCKGVHKYLEVEYQCIPAPVIKSVVACEHSSLQIACEAEHVIWVLKADYGRTSKIVCNSNGDGQNHQNHQNHPNCTSEDSSFRVVNLYCLGKQQCNITATNDLFGEPCKGTYKYLEVDYVCTK